jgi:hypothetical protein
MKNLLSITALALALLPTVGEAQTPIQSQSFPGNYILSGAQISTNVDPSFTVASLSFNALGGQYSFNIPTNISLIGIGGPNGGGTYSGVAEIPIYGFSVQCLPYNSTIATLAPPGYPYNPETTGIGGGTIQFAEVKQTSGAAVVIGNLVLPPSPHGGPYVDAAVLRLPAAYIPTLGSFITANITVLSGSVSDQYQSCYINAQLE